MQLLVRSCVWKCFTTCRNYWTSSIKCNDKLFLKTACPITMRVCQTWQATRQFVYDVNILLATYGLVLGTHYLVGFILLVVIYTKVLKFIMKIRTEFGELRILKILASRSKQSYFYVEQTHFPGRQYGATGMMIIKGQSKAKRRVVAFLTVFVISGTMSEAPAITIEIAECYFATSNVQISFCRTCT